MNPAEASNQVFPVITIRCAKKCPCCNGQGCDLSLLREDPARLPQICIDRLMQVRAFVLRFYHAEALCAN